MATTDTGAFVVNDMRYNNRPVEVASMQWPEQ
jgi:hypothetical protein